MYVTEKFNLRTVTLLIVSGWTGICYAQTTPDLEFAFHAEQLLRTDDVEIGGVEILTRPVLLDLYERNGFSPVWRSAARIREGIEVIGGAADHGLLPRDYNIEALRRILRESGTGIPAKQRAENDIVLSESLLRYGYHRRFGKVVARELDEKINFRRESFASEQTVLDIERALQAPSLDEFIDRIAPSGPIYRRLQAELERYRSVAASGGWPGVDAGPTLRRGDEDTRVAQIRRRLAVTGDLLAGADTSSETFDVDLEDAVAAFQERHALDTDGAVGARTLEAMNVPVATRVQQLRLSLERLRWIDDTITAGGMIAVNIAGFRVFYFDETGIRWYKRAMVGREYRQTPVFRGDIAYLEFNPTWTIPPGILRNDTLPAIKRDPNYLTSRNIRVIDRNGDYVDPATVDWNRYTAGIPYTLRQDPGPDNALGRVKFIFPNEHFVFLHDTPSPELFSQAERAFSSGCIRVEDPLTLAELVLGDSDRYDVSALEGIVASRRTQRLRPRTNVPVLILYLTASLDPSGYVRFYRDIYNRDQKMLEALNGPVVIDLPRQDG